MARGPSTARLVAPVIALGVALVGGVVAGTLVGSTYRSDVETICLAEARSGLVLDRDLAGVTRWVRQRLSTPKGNEFFASLGEEPFAERAVRLRAEAKAQGVRDCPTARSLDRIAADASYRADLQHLCSRTTFPGLADLDDDRRLAALETWIATQSRSPRTGELAEPLRSASPVERARFLRDAARATHVYSCDVARVFEQGAPSEEAPATSAAGADR